MTEAEYERFHARLIPEYAAEHVRSGRWSPEESLEASRREVERLLPQGPATPNEHFLTLVAGTPEQSVGHIWLHLQEKNGFIYDLLIDEAHRRQGFARDGLRALEAYARERGAARLALHVFAHNEVARGLYRGLGYQERDIVLAKDLL